MSRKTSRETTAAIIAARIAHHAGMPRLPEVDRLTGELLRGRWHSDRRYEREQPGDLLHVDVKWPGRVPDGGGWRAHGRSEKVRGRGAGWDYVRVAIDDHTGLAYAEVLPDERTGTCAEFLIRAAAWFAAHGVARARVLTDNAKSYRIGAAWIAACAQLGIRPSVHQARPARMPGCPWTNGKAVRFNRTLQSEWAYVTAWTATTSAPPPWTAQTAV
jgi:transposase InsO family protein